MGLCAIRTLLMGSKNVQPDGLAFSVPMAL